MQPDRALHTELLVEPSDELLGLVIDPAIAHIIHVHGETVRYPDSARGEEQAAFAVVQCLIEACIEVEIEEVLRGIWHVDNFLEVIGFECFIE